jgi:threonine synthase
VAHARLPQLAFEIIRATPDDIPASRPARAHRAHLHGRGVRLARHHARAHARGPGLHLLHLSNGPTLAFKDVAMQLLGNLFEYVLARGRQLNILGATSGDTGSAAEYAMRGKQGVRVFMLSPHGRMSAFQRAQMFSLRDANIFNIAVQGVFDDCQDMVKAVSNDLDFKARYAIGTVNSINWARWSRRWSTTSRATSRSPAATTSRSRSRCRRATSATCWPATSRA